MNFYSKKRPIEHLLLVFLLCASFSNFVFSQIDTNHVQNNPYTVIYNHLYYLQPDSYIPERAALSLSRNITDVSIEQSIKLKQILDAKGLYIDLNRLPKNPNYTDSISRDKIYYLSNHENWLYVERIDSSWFYSETTIENIDQKHQEIFPFGNILAKYFHAPYWQVKVLNIKIWKWLALFTLLLASYAIFYLFRLISQPVLNQFFKNRIVVTEEIQKVFRKFSRVFGLLIATRFVIFILPMLQIPPQINTLLIKGVKIASICFFTILLRYLIDIAFHFLKKVTERTESTMDDQLLPVLKRLAIMVLWLFGVFYILDFLEINVTALIAGISIGGLALALAAQDTVKNFFGSVMIFLDRPFQIGDWIQAGEIDGTVEEVGFRSSRIRTFANSIMYVPNATLADSTINNMGLRLYRRYNTTIGVTYDTPPAKIDEFVEGIRELIRKHPTTRKDYFEVHLNHLGSHSIDILLYVFFQVPNWTQELEGKHILIRDIIYLANQIHVEFAFPTQTIHLSKV